MDEPDTRTRPRAYRTPARDRLSEVRFACSTNLRLDARGGFTLSDGTILEPRTFTLLSPTGESLAGYGDPSEYALDDYLYILGVYFVRERALCRATLELGGQGTWSCTLGASEVVLDGLVADYSAR